MFPLSLHNYIEIGAFLVSVVSYFRLREDLCRWFSPFLFCVVMVELVGRYYRKVLHLPNAWIFNISTVCEFVFYAWVFYSAYSINVYRRIAIGFIFVYPVIAFLNMAFLQGFEKFHSYTMALGSLSMIVFSCLYFDQLLKIPVKINLLRTPMFWIASGILFFYLGNLVYEILFDFLETSRLDFQHKLFRAINNSLILVLYSFFIIAFTCRPKVSN